MSECIYCGKDEDDGVELIESDSPNDYFCNECLSNFEALNAINAKLRARVAELEKQEMRGMDCTLDQMLSKEQQERWGLEKQEHGRNVQLMFCRACDAIDALEERKKSQAAKIGRCEIEIDELESEVFEKDKCLSELEQQVESMRPCIRRFAEKMEFKLLEHEHKGGWGHCTDEYLFRRLYEELNELASSVTGGNAEEIAREAADVGNFAMMIMDNNRNRQPRGNDEGGEL